MNLKIADYFVFLGMIDLNNEKTRLARGNILVED
jgi:hypothetical protein